MKFADRFVHAFRTVLPSPFTIAVLLTAFVFVCALFFTLPAGVSLSRYASTLAVDWYHGIWNAPLIVFAFQMMFMLVLGHAVALSKPVDRVLSLVSGRVAHSSATAALVVTAVTISVAWVNWGLGLIVGAVLARKVGEAASRAGSSLNYALIGACGYAGLMVWHGGISGSSLIKVVESGNIRTMATGTGLTEAQVAALPESMTFAETVFSPFNLTLSLVLLLALPALMGWLGKRSKKTTALPDVQGQPALPEPEGYAAEKLDFSKALCIGVGAAVLGLMVYKAYLNQGAYPLKWLNPNWINTALLGTALVLHGRFVSFFKALDSAIGGASGILVQFPLYFGILALMKSSGMIGGISAFFVELADGAPGIYPLITFFSAGLVNVFVPSGGGQWAVQGPIIIESATQLGVPLNKSILAMAYGDQLTNMLQPFWALPLLSITGLKARDILPYTLLLLAAGMVIFGIALVL